MNWICLKCGEFVDYFDAGKTCPRCGWKRPRKMNQQERKIAHEQERM